MKYPYITFWRGSENPEEKPLCSSKNVAQQGCCIIYRVRIPVCVLPNSLMEFIYWIFCQLCESSTVYYECNRIYWTHN